MRDLAKSASFNRDNLLALFNLNEEDVMEIDVSHKSDAVYIYIKLNKQEHKCPVCESKTSRVKAYTNKKILHSLLSNYPCFIIYRARRYVCETCRKTFYEHNPFTHKNMKISVVTVSNVLLDLKKVSETFTSVANRYNLSSTTVASIFDSHVVMSRKMLPELLCIDECYAFSSSQGNYVCVLIDFETKNTIDLLPSRRKQDLIRYFDRIPLEERKRVKMVCIDMWETYRVVAKAKLPNAQIALDKFHVLQELRRKVIKVRNTVMNKNKGYKITKKLEIEAKRSKEARIKLYNYKQKNKNYYLLKKFRWLLLINEEKRKTSLDMNNKKKFNRTLNQYTNFYDLLNMILNIDPQLKKAYYFLIKVDEFFREANINNAKVKIDKIIDYALHSEVVELNSYGHTLMRWRREIINSFYIINEVDEYGEVFSRKINNGIAENKNRTLKLIKNHSNGYRNWERFRNRSLYVLNDDATYNLYPVK